MLNAVTLAYCGVAALELRCPKQTLVMSLCSHAPHERQRSGSFLGQQEIPERDNRQDRAEREKKETVDKFELPLKNYKSSTGNFRVVISRQMQSCFKSRDPSNEKICIFTRATLC